MNLHRHFSKEDIEMSNKHKKRCATSLSSGDIQIKTKMSYHFNPTKTAKMKKTNRKDVENVEKLEVPFIAGETVTWLSHFGKV
jgi:hypothetical protein